MYKLNCNKLFSCQATKDYTLPIRRSMLRSIVAFLVVMVVLFACWMLIGVNINIPPQRPIDQLTSARATWQAKPHTDYDMWVQVGSFSMVETFKISVKDNRVVTILHSNFLCSDNCEFQAADAVTMQAYQKAFGRFFPSTLNDLTMDNLFDLAADKLVTVPAPPLIGMCSAADVEIPRYEVAYDQTRGNITSLKYTNCPRFNFGGGLMCPVVWHCNAVIEIKKLDVKK